MLRGNITRRNEFRRERHVTLPVRTGGAKRKLLIFLALIVTIIALLPTIVAKTSLRNALLSAALPTDAVRVSIGSASLSWLTGPALSGVQVSDSTGNALLAA